MDDLTDPDDTGFQRLLNREILLSERRRMLILAGVQALIFVLIVLAATFVPSFVRSIYHDRRPSARRWRPSPPSSSTNCWRPVWSRLSSSRSKFPVWGRYTNALVETSFPTVLLYLLAGYVPSPTSFSAHGRRSCITCSSFSRPCGLISRSRRSQARSPRSRSSPSPTSRCILSGGPRIRASGSAIMRRAAPSFSRQAYWPAMPGRQSRAISDARSPLRRPATK